MDWRADRRALTIMSLASRCLSKGSISAGFLALLFALLVCDSAAGKRAESSPFLRRPTEVLLFVAHVQGILGLYRIVESLGSLAVSASWAAYAAAVLAFAASRKDAVWARSSLIILGLAAGKALLYDVSNAGPVVRILCLLLTGGLLFAGGWLFRRVSDWEKAAA